jgi:hypothetical protein
LPSVNPYNGQTLKTYLEMSAEDVDNAIAKAHERFSAWRRVTFAQRASLLLGCPLRGAELDGRKRGDVEVLDQRSAMCRSDRPTVPGRGLPNERLHEPRANIGIRVLNRVTHMAAITAAAVRGGNRSDDRGLPRECPARLARLALIISAIKLLPYDTGGEAALSGVQGERTRRAAEVTGTAERLGYES